MQWLLSLAAGAVMLPAGPTDQEIAMAHWWADGAFLGEDQPVPVTGPGLVVLEHTHGTLRRNVNVWLSPLRLAGKEYSRGLGDHATSRVRVHLPGPGARFLAAAGVDDNPNTRIGSPSVRFSVEADGRERLRTDVLRVADPPVEVDVGLGGAAGFVLGIDDGGDGPACDQADWADARVELADGSVVYLDELPVLVSPSQPRAALPFSVRLGGQPVGLATWGREVEATETGHWLTLTSPDGLALIATVRRFDDFPAVEWLVELENRGDSDSLLIEDLLTLDLNTDLSPGEWVRVHHARGSTCEISDFLPGETTLAPEERLQLAPVGGRSSNGTAPFFNIDWGNGGATVAIGWSGQWRAEIERPTDGKLRLTAGQEALRLRLRPGERIRGPRILVTFWQGDDPMRGHNLHRRLMLAHYCPRDAEGELLLPPIAHPTAWAILASGEPANEANQLEMLKAAADLGAEAYWLDAYWFPRGFPSGVGSWFVRPGDFPRGLKPLADAAHARAMDFILWFEPERVARATQIAEEHPEFCLEAGPGDLLYNLGDPEALRFMVDLLSQRLEQWDVDVYREDFNIDPLPFWRAADEPEREGLKEIRFVEGLYAMWDGLVERKPGLAIDNCASGGRRIDLETASRSWALWRSDFQDVGVLSRPNPLGDAAIASQVQNASLGRFVPFSANGLYSFDPYSVRSAMSGCVLPYFDLRGDVYDREEGRAAIAEVKALRRFFLGDLHPLTPITVSPRDWCAYQLDRPDLREGIALFFRRNESPYLAVTADLRALDAEAEYEWSLSLDYRPAEWLTTTGRELAAMRIDIPERPGAALLRYRRTAR